MKRHPTRRTAIVRGSSLLLAGPATTSELLAATDRPPALRFGAVTDIHYADKETRGTRHYRESAGKLEAALQHLEEHNPSFVVELGDLIDRTESEEEEISYLKRIDGFLRQEDRKFIPTDA